MLYGTKREQRIEYPFGGRQLSNTISFLCQFQKNLPKGPFPQILHLHLKLASSSFVLQKPDLPKQRSLLLSVIYFCRHMISSLETILLFIEGAQHQSFHSRHTFTLVVLGSKPGPLRWQCNHPVWYLSLCSLLFQVDRLDSHAGRLVNVIYFNYSSHEKEKN